MTYRYIQIFSYYSAFRKCLIEYLMGTCRRPGWFFFQRMEKDATDSGVPINITGVDFPPVNSDQLKQCMQSLPNNASVVVQSFLLFVTLFFLRCLF